MKVKETRSYLVLAPSPTKIRLIGFYKDLKSAKKSQQKFINSIIVTI